MAVALAFGRWDVDDFLNEIPDDLYREWLEFHSTIQPLDPTYMIMRGLMGSSVKPRDRRGGWEQSLANLRKHSAITSGRQFSGRR